MSRADLRAAALVVQALTRSWRHHRLRVLASLAAAVLATMLATVVAAVTLEMFASLRAGTAVELLDADVVAAARSPAGLAEATALRLMGDDAVGPSLAVLQVRTRLAERDEDILVLGVDGDVGDFLPAAMAGTGPARESPGADAEAGVVVGADWADRLGVRPGDQMRLAAPGGPTAVTVVGLLEGAVPNRGAVAIGPRQVVGAAFGRPGQVDVVYARAAVGTGQERLAARFRQVAGTAATVGDPEMVVAPELSSIAVVRTGMVIAGALGVTAAVMVQLVCWQLMLEDERPTISRLRLVGARSRDLATGSALVLGGAALVTTLVGVAGGLAAASRLGGVTAGLLEISGLAVSPSPPGGPVSALAGASVGLLVSLLGWGIALRPLLAPPPIEAIRGPEAGDGSPTSSVAAWVAAGALGTGAWIVVQRGGSSQAGAALLLALVTVAFAARAVAPLVARLLSGAPRFSVLIAGRHLRSSGALLAVFAVAMALAVTLFGISASMERAIAASAAAWTRGDLFVVPAPPGTQLRDEKFGADVEGAVAAVPGVAEVLPFVASPFVYRERKVQLYAWEARRAPSLVHLVVDEGVSGRALWQELARGRVAVSGNLARLEGIGLGDRIPLPGQPGSVGAEVVAIVEDHLSENGIVYLSLETYRRLTGDDRTFLLTVELAPGASAAGVAGELRGVVGDYPDARVWTRGEIRSHLQAVVGRLLGVFRLLALVSLVLAVLAGTTISAAAIARRRRSFGLTRLCGAAGSNLRTQLGIEATVIGGGGWVLGVAASVATVRLALVAVRSQTGLDPAAVVPLTHAAVILPAALAAASIAVGASARRATKMDIAEALRDE